MRRFRRERQRLRVSTLALAALILVVQAVWGLPLGAAASESMVPRNELVLWLRADEGVEVENDRVIMWRDQSGRGNHAVAEPSHGPALSEALVNGQPAVIFDGTTTYMQVPHDESLNAGAEFTVIAVFSYEGDGIRLAQKRSGGAGNEDDAWYVNPRGGLAVAGVRETKRIFDEGRYHLQGSVFSGNEGELRIYGNGELLTTKTGAKAQRSNSDDVFIGKRDHSTGQHFKGALAELLIYRRALSDVERMMVEGYLMEKYALGAELCAGPPTDPLLGLTPDERRVSILANEYDVLWRSPNPRTIYSATPGIVRLESGRLVATMTFRGPGTTGPDNGLVYTSDDDGATWDLKASIQIVAPRPFEVGGTLYVLGHLNDIVIYRSDDEGESWSGPHYLTYGQKWQGAATSYVVANDRVYHVMERITLPEWSTWAVAAYAPVVMAASVHDDLTQRSAWTFSNEITFFRDAAPLVSGIGAPFYPMGPTSPGKAGGRNMHPLGWLEANLIQIHDPNHVWYDPNGRTFHIFMRAHTGTTNLAAIAQVVEDEEGALAVDLVRTPSGEPMIYVPLPGGQMKFHIIYDEPSGLYWLVSSQSVDSMTRPEALPLDRYGLPSTERHRLALYYSKNAVDWQLAGLVAVGATPRESRHYAAMAVVDDDLIILSRSGDACAFNAHEGNLITIHRVENFRDLVIPF